VQSVGNDTTQELSHRKGRSVQHSRTRKVAVAFPKSSDASPITSLANK
jgi:hypothetical protein